MERGQSFDRCIVIDDDQDILLSARLLLRDMFKAVDTFQAPADALNAMAEELPDVVLLDANFGRGETSAAEGFHWLNQILKLDPEAVVVMITAHAGVQIAVEAMKRGATDFVSKPWPNERLLATVRTGASLRRSRETASTERKRRVAANAPAPGPDTAFLGNSPGIARIFSLIQKAAPTDANVLIIGENGTGK
ncbi:MAG: response regulator, partial [Pseudomonadota bacterium]|nr:response regulator [Pseudomonadota bacterium]